MPTFDDVVKSKVAAGQALGEPTEGTVGGVDVPTAAAFAADPALTGKFRYALDAGETTVTVANTTVTSFLFDYTLPGGTLENGDRLYIEAAGDILNESGGAVNYSFRQYVGTTLALTGQNISVGSVATNRRKWVYRAMISVDGTGAQRVDATLTISYASGFAMVSVVAATDNQIGYGTAAEDLSTDKRIALAIVMGTAHASADCRLHHYTVERLGNP